MPVRRRSAFEDALVARLKRIPAGDISETARRAGVSLRQLMRLRSGDGDVKLSTLVALAEALGEHPAELIGGARRSTRHRPAPIGRRQGKPRGIRRDNDLGEPFQYEEDLPANGHEEV